MSSTGTDRDPAFDTISRVVRAPMQICCEECREDPTGALYLEADAITRALLDEFPDLADIAIRGTTP